MDQNLVKLSRTISHALRHAPEQYGLKLDEEGWVPVQDLLAALRQRRAEWQHLHEHDLAAMVAQSEKQRFEMRDGKIRALYGHSTQKKVAKEPAIPPALLYHGTTARAAQSIRAQGLRSMKRQYVHLSTDEQTARQVALRRTRQPVLLKIVAAEAHKHGVKFYLGNEMVWLAEYIPPEFIS